MGGREVCVGREEEMARFGARHWDVQRVTKVVERSTVEMLMM